jgi:hypothetical protein
MIGAVWALLVAGIVFFVAAAMGFDRAVCGLGLSVAGALLGLASTIKRPDTRTVWDVIHRIEQR